MRLSLVLGPAAALFCASVAPAACTSSHVPECTGPMSEVGAGCPETFAGSLVDVMCTPGQMQAVYSCDGLDVLGMGYGFYGNECAYDPSTHVLVGGRELNDLSPYCQDSIEISAGRFPGDVCPRPGAVIASRTCPGPGVDGGADLADGGGVSE
ncbi:MAG TPA: hypothetical protein VHL80_15975 [Polyangia bacterium]|nr:hypothetical protein [Polyangia bacterium]